MDKHTCNSIVITCIDFRLQKYIHDWLNQNFEVKTFDRVALAGGVKDLDYILKQVDIAFRLHHINKVVLINHEDCGAYGLMGTLERHTQDLQKAEGRIRVQMPELTVEKYYLHLDGTFEKI